MAFPVADGEKRERLFAQMIATARRLADLVAEPDAHLPNGLGERVEAVVGELCEVVERKRRS